MSGEINHPLENSVRVTSDPLELSPLEELANALQPEGRDPIVDTETLPQHSLCIVQDPVPMEMSIYAMWDETLKRLADLSSLEYEKIRKGEAKRLGVRPSVLDQAVDEVRPVQDCGDSAEECGDIEPWPEPVQVDQVLDEALGTIKRYVVCSDATAVLAVLWIVFTWFIDYLQVAPIAIITSPRPRCGKTTLLQIIAWLSRRSLLASNITGAAIFQVIEAYRPTLLIDETDSFMRRNEQIRGVINSGHTRTTAFVFRAGKKDGLPRKYSTFCAKVLCGIGKQAETITDRAVLLKLRRKLKEEKVHRLRFADKARFTTLARKFARLAEDHGTEICNARPQIPDELNDRAQDNWEPLLAIAELAGEDWAQKAREAAIPSAEDEEESDISVMLLADIQRVFATVHTDVIGGRRVKRIQTKQLLHALALDDSRPWATAYNGAPMIAIQLSECLEPFGIKSANDKWPGGKVRKGYRLEQFEDAFLRYLRPAEDHIPDQGNGSSDDETAIRYYATSPDSCGFTSVEPVAVADDEGDLEGVSLRAEDQDDAATSEI